MNDTYTKRTTLENWFFKKSREIFQEMRRTPDEVSPEQSTTVSDLSPMRRVERMRPRATADEMRGKGPRAVGICSRGGKTPKRRIAPSRVPEAESQVELSGPEVLGPGEPPRKLPRVSKSLGCDEVLLEGGELPDVDPHTPRQEPMLVSSEEAGKDWAPKRGARRTGRRREGLQRPVPLRIPSYGVTTRITPADQDRDLAGFDRVWGSVRVESRASNPNPVRGNEHWENHVGVLVTPERASDETPRQVVVLPNLWEGRTDPGRHDVQAPARRSSNSLAGLSGGYASARSLPRCGDTSEDSEDHHDEQEPLGGRKPKQPGDSTKGTDDSMAWEPNYWDLWVDGKLGTDDDDDWDLLGGGGVSHCL